MLQTLIPLGAELEDSEEDERAGQLWGVFSNHMSIKMAAVKVTGIPFILCCAPEMLL